MGTETGRKQENIGHRAGYWAQGRRLGAKSRRVGVGRRLDARMQKYVYMTTPLKIAAKNAKMQQRTHVSTSALHFNKWKIQQGYLEWQGCGA